MERTGPQTATSTHAWRLRVALLLLGGVLALGGCYVVPAQTVSRPAPCMWLRPRYTWRRAPVYSRGGYGWRRHGRW